MSTLTVATVKSNTSGPPVFQNTSGTEIGTLCRAWVNFNGSGVVAIRAQYNVSSITDNGVGQYTVNFTTAMPDANYSASVTRNDWGTVAAPVMANGLTILAGSYQVVIYRNDGLPSLYDSVQIAVAIFR